MCTRAPASPSLHLQCKPRDRVWLQAQLKAGGMCLESTPDWAERVEALETGASSGQALAGLALI